MIGFREFSVRFISWQIFFSFSSECISDHLYLVWMSGHVCRHDGPNLILFQSIDSYSWRPEIFFEVIIFNKNIINILALSPAFAFCVGDIKIGSFNFIFAFCALSHQ